MAEGRMLDTCTAARPGTSVLNESTGQLTPTAGATVYTGPCRVKASKTVGTPDVGGAEWTVQQLEVHLPIGTSGGVTVGCLVTITACPNDAAMVGRRFRVTAGFGMTDATARRLSVEAAS